DRRGRPLPPRSCPDPPPALPGCRRSCPAPVPDGTPPAAPDAWPDADARQHPAYPAPDRGKFPPAGGTSGNVRWNTWHAPQEKSCAEYTPETPDHRSPAARECHLRRRCEGSTDAGDRGQPSRSRDTSLPSSVNFRTKLPCTPSWVRKGRRWWAGRLMLRPSRLRISTRSAWPL